MFDALFDDLRRVLAGADGADAGHGVARDAAGVVGLFALLVAGLWLPLG